MSETIIIIALLIFLGFREYLHDRSNQQLNTALHEATKTLTSLTESQKAKEVQFKQVIQQKDQIIIDLQRIQPGGINEMGEASDEGYLADFNPKKITKVMVDGEEKDIQIYG